MAEHKHTPGPWTASPPSSVVGILITAQPDLKQNQMMVAGVMSGEANAALIAAAPDLLAACIELDETLKIFVEARAQPDAEERPRRRREGGDPWLVTVKVRGSSEPSTRIAKTSKTAWASRSAPRPITKRMLDESRPFIDSLGGQMRPGSKARARLDQFFRRVMLVLVGSPLAVPRRMRSSLKRGVRHG